MSCVVFTSDILHQHLSIHIHMGREWLYWMGGGGRRRSSMSTSAEEGSSSSTGCMCAVFQLFDLNQFHQHSFHNNNTFLQQQAEASSLKGVEAPTNSLDLDQTESIKPPSNPLSIKQQGQDNLNFPVGINQIKTRASISKTEDLASDCSTNSPGTKTPNLVARLMGLDLLPQCSSPSSNPNPQTKSHLYRNRCFSDDDISVGARSLPETPRTSSSRRSDVDHHHRLSLQINKEGINEEFVGKRGRFRKQDENSNSPGNYAKQIVKQVKESVSRRVGLLDITNTNNRSEKDEHRRDQNLLIKLHKKSPKLSPKLDGGEISPDFKQSTTPSSCSPKLRFLDSRKCRSVTDTNIKSPRNSSSSESCSNSSKPKLQVIIQEQQNDCRKIELGKSCGVKKLSSQISVDKGMRNKKEEAFVRSASAAKKMKKSPLSTSELVHISRPTLLPIKKDPSPPATKLPQKQVSSDSLSSKRNTQLSCNTSHPYNNQLHNLPHKISTAAAPEYRSYVNKILKRAGIADKFTPLTLGKWHTPSHPLDPSIFYYLELFHPAAASAASAAVSRRCNRRLIFQLVDELLEDILRPRLDFKIFPILGINDCIALDDELCRRIESFPAANCRVLEDIDCLVDNDLCKTPLSGCYREETERLVCEIEGEIVERLVCETVGLVAVPYG